MKKTIFKSSDSNVFKFVFENPEIAVEAVLYRYGEFRKRTVICCSTQCGCPMGCAFCGTGEMFVRNLTPEEIEEQIHKVLEEIDCPTSEIEKFQIMFMSMGEPFLNYYNVKEAIIHLHSEYPNAQLLVSTVAPIKIWHNGFNDFIHLSREIDKIGIQFSVHESTDDRRKNLIRGETLDLDGISTLGDMWAIGTNRRPFYNYCVHEGNDTDEDADRLVKLFNPTVWETTLSVICESDESVKASIDRQLERIKAFSKKLIDRGASVRIFNPAGQDDIGGGCGQLWYFQKWWREHNQYMDFSNDTTDELCIGGGCKHYTEIDDGEDPDGNSYHSLPYCDATKEFLADVGFVSECVAPEKMERYKTNVKM